ncbi:MAG: hypothetical protein NTZ80_02335 [Patescibacteria group bacterium]|nr:hypothetical protein [Patescibacteria group bacterium]
MKTVSQTAIIAVIAATLLITSIPAQAQQLQIDNINITKQEVYIPLSTLCPNIWDGYIGADNTRYCLAYCYLDHRTHDCTFTVNGCPDSPNSYLGDDNRCYCKDGLNWNDTETSCVSPKPACGNNAFLNGNGRCQCNYGYKWMMNGEDCTKATNPIKKKNRQPHEFFPWY